MVWVAVCGLVVVGVVVCSGVVVRWCGGVMVWCGCVVLCGGVGGSVWGWFMGGVVVGGGVVVCVGWCVGVGVVVWAVGSGCCICCGVVV